MPHARKKVIRKNGKRYYRAGKSGLVRLKGGKKPPHAYSKADAYGGSKYEVSHIVGKGAYGVVW